MFLFPFPFLLLGLAGLFSLGLLGGGLYLIYAWYTGIVVGTAWLAASVVMLALSFMGRFLVLPLLGRPDDDAPRMVQEGEIQRIAGADGVELEVEVYGPADAQPLVLTHAWGLNSTEWYYARQELGRSFRLFAWDLRGLGGSTRPDNAEYSTERMAHDLRAVLGLAGDRRAILLGHSIGGMVLLTFCRLFPDDLRERVERLVLVDTTYTNPVRTALFSGFLTAIQKPILEPLMHLTVWLAPLSWLMNWTSYLNGTLHLTTALTGFGGRQTRGQVDFTARFQLVGWPGVLGRGSLAMLRYDETATLPQIDTPTLVITGDRDLLTKPEANRHISQAIPTAELVTLAPAGHMSVLEQHTRFADAVTEFAAEGAPADVPVLSRP